MSVSLPFFERIILTPVDVVDPLDSFFEGLRESEAREGLKKNYTEDFLKKVPTGTCAMNECTP